MSAITKKHKQYIAISQDEKKFKISGIDNDHLKINGKSGEYKIEKNKEGFVFLTLNRKKFNVEIIEKHQNHYIVSVNGVYYNFSIETPISFKRRNILKKRNGKSNIEQIKAPMPGKIVSFLIENETKVNEGTPLYILEAMKMQNEVSSPVAGIVRNVLIKENVTVMKDDVILEIAKED
jgi:biotin carboxyl carrier protein